MTKGEDVTKIKGFHIPDEYKIDKNAHVYEGIVIAVGDRTKAARFGRERGWFEPGDKVYFWNLYNFADKDVVLKDEKTGNEYLTIEEDDVKAYELTEEGT